MIKYIICVLFVFSLNGENLNPQEEIIQTLQKWSADFNSQNIKGVCGLFAQDLIASYPDSQDRTYEEMCTQLTHVITQKDKTYLYDAPKIEQIIVNGDLAVVRLIWTLTVSNSDHSKIETINEKGIDVLKRQPDGSWKIHISYAYPLN